MELCDSLLNIIQWYLQDDRIIGILDRIQPNFEWLIFEKQTFLEERCRKDRILYLISNRYTYINTITVKEYKNLRYLNMTHCMNLKGLEYLPPRLEVLCCSYNPKLEKLPKMPDGLKKLDCNNCSISELELNENIENLVCDKNFITSMPGLYRFNRLTKMDISNNFIKELDSLPPNIKRLLCDGNNLTWLPDLPDSLTCIDMSANSLTELPKLPPNLVTLYCETNRIKYIKNLPGGLRTLDCSYNRIKSIDTIPSSMKTLYCNNNRLTRIPPIPRDLVMMKFHNNNLDDIITYQS